jgi:hypothetical protein
MTTMTFTAVALLIATHFLADFVLQSDWMATNKSKRWDALALHVGIYTLCFAWVTAVPGVDGAAFLAVTFASHFATDAVTSRITSRLFFFRREAGIWAQAEYTMPKHGRTLVNPWMPIEANRHWFFVALGVDQLIHYYTLMATWIWLSH